MRAVVLGSLAVLLGGCNEPPAKTKSVLDRLEAGDLNEKDVQRVRSTFPGMTKACIEKVRIGGVNAMPERAEDCFEMTPRQRWRGLWRAQYEGSRFCPAPARDCTDQTAGDRVWLNFRDGAPQNELQGRGGLYEIEFEGRRTVHRGMHGHFGGSDHVIIVERLIALRELEAAQQDMTPAEMEAAKKECEASPNCYTDAELDQLRRRKR